MSSLPLTPRPRVQKFAQPIPLAADAWTVALLPPGEPAIVAYQDPSLTLALATARGCLLDALNCGVAILPPAPELELPGDDWDADDEVMLTAKGGGL